MIELDIAQAASIGARAEQQDAVGSAKLGTGDGASLMVLADGLGGHADGALASKIVIQTFGEVVGGGQFDEPGTRRLALHGAIQEVNRRIHNATDPMDGHRSMASTAVAAIVANGTVRWISVGDSHLYVCRNGRLSKLNADHSQAGIMIRHGYSPNDEAVINARSVLVSALTGREIEEIDNPAHDVALEVGDVVLLASDGLNTLSDTEIALVIDQNYEKGAEAICSALIKKVTDRGLPRQDNTTVVAGRVLSFGPRAASDPDSPSLPLTEATTRTDVPTAPVTVEPEPMAPKAAPSPASEALAPSPAMAADPAPAMMAPAATAPPRDPVSEPITAAMPAPDRKVEAMLAPEAAPRRPSVRPATGAGAPAPGMAADRNMARRRLLLKVLATAMAAAAIASVIVTQTM